MPRLWSDLRQELRDRIGEPESADGTWLQADLLRYFNRGQEQVCRDIKTEGTDKKPPLALLIDEVDVRLFKGVNQYRLPKDSIDVVMVFHRSTGDENWRPLAQGAIRTLIDLADPSSLSENLTRYEVYGRTGKLMASGVNTGGDNTSCIDSDRASNAVYRFDTGTGVLDDSPTPAALAANDRVFNLTDGSSSDVSSIAAGDLTLDGLTGGMRNVCQLGDRFEVVAAEDTREWLNLYPVPDTYGDVELVDTSGTVAGTYAIGNDNDVNQKVGQEFKLTNRATVRYIDIHSGSNTGTPRGNIVLTVETDSSGPSGTLLSVVGKAVISEAAWAPSSVNRFQLEFDITPTVNTSYWVTLQTETQSTFYGSTDDIDNFYTWQYGVGTYSNGNVATHNGSSWTEVAANDAFMKLWQAPANEHLRVHYARTPAPMTATTDVCELPQYGIEACLLWAERQAFMKIQDRDSADRSLQKYRIEVELAKERLQQTKQHPMSQIRQRHWRLPRIGHGHRVNHVPSSGMLRRVPDFD